MIILLEKKKTNWNKALQKLISSKKQGQLQFVRKRMTPNITNRFHLLSFPVDSAHAMVETSQ